MDTGAIVHATVNDAAVELSLDSWVPVDPSCYQYDAGWWAYNVDDETSEYFVSMSGVVYGKTPTEDGQLDAFSTEVGQVVCGICGSATPPERCNEFQMTGECRQVFSVKA